MTTRRSWVRAPLLPLFSITGNTTESPPSVLDSGDLSCIGYQLCVLVIITLTERKQVMTMQNRNTSSKKKKRNPVFLWMIPILVLFLFAVYEVPGTLYGISRVPGTVNYAGIVYAADQKSGKSDQNDISKIPAYKGSPYIEINDNRPSFAKEDLTTEAFEYYSELDRLGRCGAAFANVGPETMPAEERGPIGEVHPSGWQIANYHDLIDGNYLYNRCHLIAYSLAGENANEKNLITGTRYLNTEGMQPFELEVLEYIRSTGNHVLYRVTPVFEGDNLVASGVFMEGMSVEDQGKEVSFHVFVYNVQPGVIIDYSTGDNRLDLNYEYESEESDQEEMVRGYDQEEEETDSGQEESDEETDPAGKEENDEKTDPAGKDVSENSYVLNTNTHKFHRPSCSSVDDMKDKNKLLSNESREEIIQQGYKPCARCSP